MFFRVSFALGSGLQVEDEPVCGEVVFVHMARETKRRSSVLVSAELG